MFEPVWPLYLATCFFLFRHAARYTETPIRRWKFFFLAVAVMGFGTGRFLWWLNPDSLPQIDWIFTLAHWSLAIFAALYLLCAHADHRKEARR